MLTRLATTDCLHHRRGVLTFEADLAGNAQLSWPYVALGRKPDVNTASFWGSAAQGAKLDGALQITSPNGYVNAGDLLGVPGTSCPPVPVACHMQGNAASS